jgi:hypothetical protein
MHNSRGSFITKLYRRKTRFWPAGREDKPIVHQSVIARSANKDNNYQPWILGIAHDVETWIPFEDQKWLRKL